MTPTSKSHQFEPIIRSTTVDDAFCIRKMQADSWNLTYPNKKAGVTLEWVKERTSKWLTAEGVEKSRQHFSNIIKDSDNYHCVAAEADEIVGVMHASKANGAQHLEMIYIKQSKFGTGLAQRLIDTAFAWFDMTKPIVLEVANYNQRAIAFYIRNGFEIENGSEHMFADKLIVLNMIRRGDK